MVVQRIHVSQWLPAGGRAGAVCLLEDTWGHLGTCFIFKWKSCSWHPVGKDQGCRCPSDTQHSHSKEASSPTGRSAEAEEPCCE